VQPHLDVVCRSSFQLAHPCAPGPNGRIRLSDDSDLVAGSHDPRRRDTRQDRVAPTRGMVDSHLACSRGDQDFVLSGHRCLAVAELAGPSM